MLKKDKVLMVVPFLSSFIRSDIAILSCQYRLVLNHFNWKIKFLVPFYMFMQGLWVLGNVFSAKKIVIEFGGFWALVPSFIGKLFRIPVVIVLHGTDCASMPGVNYGSLRKPLLRQVCRLSYKYASLLLPVSSSLLYTENDYIPEDNIQGVRHYFPELKTLARVVPNGLSFDFWSASAQQPKEDKRFVAVFSSSQFALKGGDLLLSLAERMPDCQFYICGCELPDTVKSTLANVHFLGKLSPEALREEYQKARFHFQLSMYEGFGMALCEAMLCECIPIGSAVNSIPEIIGDSGFVLKKKDSDSLLDLIRMAIATEDKEAMGIKARERIRSNYGMERRSKELLAAIASV